MRCLFFFQTMLVFSESRKTIFLAWDVLSHTSLTEESLLRTQKQPGRANIRKNLQNYLQNVELKLL